MILYRFYRPNGLVQHTQFCLTDEAADAVSPLVDGLPWVKSENNAQGYVRNGAFIEFPPQPSPVHVFDYSVFAWVDPRTIAEHRAAAWERIKAARAAAFSAGVTVPGIGKFDSDDTANLRITATYAALDAQPPTWTVEWTLYDNTVATLNKEQFRTVALTVLGHGNVVQSIGNGLRIAIDQTSDIAALDAINWPT